MATVSVRNSEGSEIEQIDLSPGVFETDINLQCVRAAVTRQLARRRQGTAATKTRGMVRGGGAKPWRQKGTGRARAGSIRSPLWRGGSTTFGPQPREYGGRINRKVARSAILSCLTAFANENQLVVVDSFDFPEPKTRRLIEILAGLQIDADRVLILTAGSDLNLALSARNIPMVDVINCDNINVVDLTTHDVLIATKEAIQRLEECYA